MQATTEIAGSNLTMPSHTLPYAMQQLTPGDTLYLRSGIYSDTVYLRSGTYSSGTSANPITIKSYPNEMPIIGSNDASFGLIDLKWWVFEDLIFENSRPITFGHFDISIPSGTNQCVMAENIIVRRVRFQHSNTDGIRIQCGRSITIENNIFDNLRSRTVGLDAFGVFLVHQADNIIISGNHFSDIGADGIHFLDTDGSRYIDINIIDNEFEVVRPYRYRDEAGTVIPEGLRPFDNVGENAIDIKQGPGPIFISNNRIHGFRPTSGEDASGSNGEGISISNQASGITIGKNYFYDNVIHLNVGRGNNAEVYPDRGLSVLNNIFKEPADPGVYGNQIPSGMRLISASNVKIFNNTFYNSLGYEGWVLGIVDTNNVELKNNVFGNGIIAIDTDSVNNLTADHNAWSGITANTWTGEMYPVVQGVNDITADNLGIDLLTWSPLESSPLIDAGVLVGITEDFYGAEVTGSAPDIGAVEYQPQNTGIPSALITSPADGATVSGDVQVTAVASDDVGVTKVTFAVDGVWAARDTSAPYTFDWNSSMYPDGLREIRATAFDIDGNTNTYTIHVTVDSLNDIQKPSVSITGPTEGAIVSGNVQVTAAAVDNQEVSKVVFAIDGVWAARDTTAPYSFTWDTSNYANGVHEIQATADDLAGNSSKHILYVTTDNTAPDTEVLSVTITEPTNGAIVSGNVSQSGGASSSGGGGGGGGCTTNSGAKIDPVWLLILLVSSSGYARTRCR